MYILDTDHLSLIQRNGKEGKQILTKLATLKTPEVAVTVITYEEQIRGRLSIISKAKTLDEQVIAYQKLQQLAVDYRSIPIIPFSRNAVIEYQRMNGVEKRLDNTRVNLESKINDTRSMLDSQISVTNARLNAITIRFFGMAGILMTGLLTILNKVVFLPNNLS